MHIKCLSIYLNVGGVCFQGVKQVLVKLGAKGSALFVEGEKPIKQSIIPAARVIDTTGAGDTFTASFAVGFVEGKSREECLRFAGTLVKKDGSICHGDIHSPKAPPKKKKNKYTHAHTKQTSIYYPGINIA